MSTTSPTGPAVYVCARCGGTYPYGVVHQCPTQPTPQTRLVEVGQQARIAAALERIADALEKSS